MKIRTRKILLASAMAAVAACVIGSAAARFPKIGVEWAEWTNYDSNGNAVGGGRIECDGTMLTWGEPSWPGGGMTLHRCN